MVPIFILTRRHSRAVSPVRGRLAGWATTVREMLNEAGRAIRRIRMEAELRRKLDGVDEHLLRDIGFRREGDRIEPTGAGRNLWEADGFDRR